MPSPRLSATIVTYRPDAALLSRALSSLAAAVHQAKGGDAHPSLGEVEVFVVDNGPPEELGAVKKALADWPTQAGAIELIEGHGNVGYGKANNLALARLRSDFHLVMNPDVELEPAALAEALAALHEHAEVGLVAPAVHGDDGRAQFLCKRYPSVWVLFLRGFAPAFLQRRFAGAIARYEMRDVIGDRFVAPVPLASGCFMLLRTPLFKELGGFDARFFMYFEDYDLSLRIGRRSAVAYVPGARIVHHGGEASRKGLRHVLWFIRSAWRFFSIHGWKIA